MGLDVNSLDAFVVIDTPLPDGTTHRTLQFVACQGRCDTIHDLAKVRIDRVSSSGPRTSG